LPDAWQIPRGSVFPLFHALADIGDFAGGEILKTTSSRPLLVEGLALRRAGRTRLMLANLTPVSQRVRLVRSGRQAGAATVRRLTAASVAAATAGPEAFRSAAAHALEGEIVELSPHELATIDNTAPSGL
jgi:hypothetical protein